MRRYVISRLVWSLSAVLVAILANFTLIRLAPGSPVDALIGDYPAPPGYAAEMTAKFGLDKSIFEQFVSYITQLAQGNWGYSFAAHQSVLRLILAKAGYTALLTIPGLTIAAVLGVFLAAFAAKHSGRWIDRGAALISLIGLSIPVFWFAQLLMLLFAVKLRWVPAQGATGNTQYTGVVDLLYHMVLPVLSLAVMNLAVVVRVGRTSIGIALEQDFIRTARAKAISEQAVLWRHAVRSTLTPIITVIGFGFAQLLTGAVLVEYVFSWPGLGNLFVESVSNRDYPVLQGIFLVAAFTVIVVNLGVDVLNARLDPRVRAAYVSKGRRVRVAFR